MRFLSPFPKYRLVAIHQDSEVLANGTTRVLAEGYTAEFKQGDLLNHEVPIARERLTFRGVPENLDRSPWDPIKRVSSFDTESIENPELRAKVEKALLTNADLGKGDGYILAEKPVIPAPWPTYDEYVAQGRRTAEMVAAKNVATAAEVGVPLEHLIAYEQDNRADAEILAVYNATLEAQNAPEPEAVTVEA